MKSHALDALKSAVPYLRLYRDKTFVVKVGGESLLSSDSAIAIFDQIATLQSLGIKIVVVHGGGPQTNDLTKRLGGEPCMIDGRRVTDDMTLESAIMAINGQAQSIALSACKGVGVSAVAVCGADAGLVTAKKRVPAKDAFDMGHVGDVLGVDPTLLRTLLAAGHLPIVSPLTVDDQGRFLNINADTVAAEIAVSLGATKLLLVTGATGILRDAADETSLVSYLSLEELKEMVSNGSLGGGMIPKAAAIDRALVGGVPRVHVIGQHVADSLLIEVLTNQGCGSMVVMTKNNG